MKNDYLFELSHINYELDRLQMILKMPDLTQDERELYTIDFDMYVEKKKKIVEKVRNTYFINKID